MTKKEPTTDFSYAGAMPSSGTVEFLIEQASDIAVHLDSNCHVAGVFVSPDSPSLGCLDHWVGRPFKDFLTVESAEKFAARIAELESDTNKQIGAIELNNSDNADWQFPIRYSVMRLQGGKGFLLIGRDLQPIAEVQQRLVHEQLARESDQQKIRRFETFYRVALEASETAMVLVDPETARIRDINSAGSRLLGAKPDVLPGNTFNQAFEGIRRGELMEALQDAAEPEETRGVELVSRRNGKSVIVFPEFFRAAGELGMLCRMLPVGGRSERADTNGQLFSMLYTASSDAIVILDAKGMVREANEAFLEISDAAQLRDVVGKSFSNFLLRGEVDLRLLIEGTVREGRLRNYSTQFKSVVGSRADVAISSAQLRSGGNEMGIGLIIRDSSGMGSSVDDGAEAVVSEQALQNVMDLVGTASLKELVSATSDVIEKMCIDTALQMTRNNRAAAADMLGLSRQSLYVKLRKYGMVGED